VVGALISIRTMAMAEATLPKQSHMPSQVPHVNAAIWNGRAD
jgi:hypothetical protein